MTARRGRRARGDGAAAAGSSRRRLRIGPLRGPDFGTSCPSTTGFVRRFPSRPARRIVALTAWDKRKRRWAARYRDADGKTRTIGYFDDQEEAAHAVNAAIRRAGLEGRRKTNPVDADGRVVPRA